MKSKNVLTLLCLGIGLTAFGQGKKEKTKIENADPELPVIVKSKKRGNSESVTRVDIREKHPPRPGQKLPPPPPPPLMKDGKSVPPPPPKPEATKFKAPRVEEPPKVVKSENGELPPPPTPPKAKKNKSAPITPDTPPLDPERA